jgi:hypothetical protein
MREVSNNFLTALVDVGYNHKDYGAVMAESFGVENWHPSVCTHQLSAGAAEWRIG